MAESSAPHCAEVSRGNSDVERGGGSEGAGWSGDVEEVREIWRSEVMDSFKSAQKDFEESLLRRMGWEMVSKAAH